MNWDEAYDVLCGLLGREPNTHEVQTAMIEMAIEKQLQSTGKMFIREISLVVLN